VTQETDEAGEVAPEHRRGYSGAQERLLRSTGEIAPEKEHSRDLSGEEARTLT
jgi:hypothetical protein